MLLFALIAALALGSWTTAPSLNEARAEIAATTLDGRIYVAGGFDRNGTDLTSVEMFDPVARVWQLRAPLPQGLNHLGVAPLNGEVYVAGGSVGGTPTSGLFAYEPNLDAWTRKADLPLRRSAHVLVAVGGRLIVVGGVGDEAGVTLAYDPLTDTWERRAPMPTVREHLSAAVVDERVYVIGGRWADQGNLATVEVYDPASDQWQSLAPMPTPRGGLTAAAMNGRIHVFGGEAFDPNRTFPQHEVYDPVLDAWTSAENLPTSRHGLGSAVLDATLYVIGGGTSAGLSTSTTVEAFRDE
ncbi:MAG TPA: kelch repeat-containing protein [Chloroflexota bacterium]|jgi:N-acetylneuraminic acid mutarotase